MCAAVCFVCHVVIAHVSHHMHASVLPVTSSSHMCHIIITHVSHHHTHTWVTSSYARQCLACHVIITHVSHHHHTCVTSSYANRRASKKTWPRRKTRFRIVINHMSHHPTQIHTYMCRYIVCVCVCTYIHMYICTKKQSSSHISHILIRTDKKKK